MYFVDDVDFIFTFRRRNDGTLTQIANVVDTSVAGGIDFDNVEIIVFEFVFKTVNFVR